MEGIERRRVCVTGAGGFTASWLVKLLLSKGSIVHGTVRDPSAERCAHLKRLENAAENLKHFKADLLDYGSIASSVAGCDGVFHVVTDKSHSFLQSFQPREVLEPAVTGRKNVLKASLEAKVKRVVVVSSGTAVSMRLDWPSVHVLDESCWSDEQYCKTIGVMTNNTLINRLFLDVIISKGYNLNGVTYNTLINWLCENGEIDKALDFIDVIKTKGYDPDIMMNNTLIKGLCKKGEIEKALDFVDVMISKGLDQDDVTYCTLSEGLCKEGEIE